MPPVEFEPTISAGERLQTYALGRAATGTGKSMNIQGMNIHKNRPKTTILNIPSLRSTLLIISTRQA